MNDASLTSLDESALILIDMQQDFLHSNGALRHATPTMTQQSVDSLIETNIRAVSAMQQAGKPVIFVRVEVRDDRADHALAPPYFKNGGLAVKFAIEGSWGACLVDGLECLAEHYSIIKKGHGSYQFTNLDRLLSTLRVHDCLYTGGAIGGCVSDTLYQGNALGYRQWIVTDAVYPPDCLEHLEVLNRFAGCIDTQDLEKLVRDTRSRETQQTRSAKIAVLVLGMQNEFLSDGGKAAVRSDSAAPQLIAGVAEFIASAHQRGNTVIHAPFIQRHDGNDCAAPLQWAQTSSGPVAVRGTWGARIVRGLAVIDSDIVVERSAPSAFQLTPLLRILRNLGVGHLVVVGGDIQQSVSSTVRDAAAHGFSVDIIEALTYPRADSHTRLLTNRASVIHTEGHYAV
jgi:nicotinamidase-related amidase